MSNKTKILFIMNSLNFGGAEKALVNLFDTMNYDVYEIDLLLLSDEGKLLNIVNNKVNIIHPDLITRNLYGEHCNFIFKFLKIIFTGSQYLITRNRSYVNQLRWKKFYKKIIPQLQAKYDVAVSFLQGDPLYYLVDKVFAKKKIAWVHNDYRMTQCNSIFDLKYFEQVNQVVTISNICLDILKEIFPSVPSIFLPNIVNSTSINSYAEGQPNEYDGVKSKKLLTIGRLNPQKGYDFLLEIAAYLKEIKYDFKWYIIGEGELKEQLLAEWREKKLEDCVYFLGTRENPYPYIKHADVVVQTSRYEGKSIVLDEAKILNKLIVCTNYDTVKDQLIDGKEGIISSFEVKEFAESIIELLADDNKMNEILNYLSSHEYGNEHVIKLYDQLFQV